MLDYFIKKGKFKVHEAVGNAKNRAVVLKVLLRL